ncbi:hypothetical protein PG994_005394 [Apiospora phragmitis]|uniref:Rhodopsin domain-containing protein n=1 Tax=Apiospora phragmitis TaxID=2905665 RepID=A0ABR1VFV0_9PEZI
MAPVNPRLETPLPQNSNGPWIVTSTWALTAVGSFFVLLRFYCRTFRSHTFAADDYLMLVAWILLLSQTILSAYSVRLGSGKHIWNIDPALSEELLMLQDITTAPSVLAVAFSKASAGVSLLRLLTFRWQRVLTIFIITSIGILMSGIMVLTAGASSFIKASTLINLSSTDPTYDIASVIVYGTAEIAVTLIAACIPVLRVLIRDVSRTSTIRYDNTLRSYGGSNNSNNTHSSARRTMITNTGSGSAVRSVKSRLSSQTKVPLEVMLENTIVTEFSDARRNSNWVLEPVNLSPRTLFDEELNKTIIETKRSSV